MQSLDTRLDPGAAAAEYPLGLTAGAVAQFDDALNLARSLADDRHSLEPVRRYLEHKHDWTQERSANAVTEYLRYLVLTRATQLPLSPSPEADALWHAHLLHSQHYAAFCQRHFAAFIHHVPSEPWSHASENVLCRQHELGELFFAEQTIYANTAGRCANGHDCHHCTVHVRTDAANVATSKCHCTVSSVDGFARTEPCDLPR